MIIIWGSRPYFRSKKIKQYGICPHCSRLVKMQSYFARECFHLYYIPLFPIRARCRFHQICGSCKQGMQWEASKFESLLQELRMSSAEAVLALMNSESVFVPSDGREPVETVPYLLDSLDWLSSAGDTEFCSGIWNQLRGTECRYARLMIEGRKHVREGQVDQALGAYHEAHLAEPKRRLPLEAKGQLLMLSKKHADARECYLKLVELADDNLKAKVIYLWHLAECETESKRFEDAAKTFDRILSLRPDLQSDKAFMKLVNKAKKKAGV